MSPADRRRMRQVGVLAAGVAMAMAPRAASFAFVGQQTGSSLAPPRTAASQAPWSRSALRMVAEPPLKEIKLDKINILKQESNNLRDPLRSEMATQEIFVNHDAYQILKFHGSYQQDDRDKRSKGAEKAYSFMLRLKMPAGECTPDLYRLLDDLSREYGHGHLRLTTRQTFQLHGVAKHNLKTVIKSLMDIGSSTVGGCGDVNRNIMATPAPIEHKLEYHYARKYSKIFAELLKPTSNAFSELWLDGQKAAVIEYWRRDGDLADVDIEAALRKDSGRGIMLDHPVEPLYGDLYMPRKFKMGVTVPGDNSLDIYTNDIGLIVVMDPTGQKLEGFNVMVGGGMGRTHGKDSTFARAADHLGFVAAEDSLELVKAILATQRDHGNREVRANARMKYLVHTLGIDRFRQLVESYTGKPVQPWRAMPEWRYSDWLGWHEQGNGKYFLGVNVIQGRVIDYPDGPKIKSAFRAVVDRYGYSLVCTPNQSVIIKGVPADKRGELDTLLASYGIQTLEEIDPLVRLSMACPALPMCGLAITEAERRMPEYNERLRALLDSEGLGDEEIMVRMTGCPNGCARPYMAELAFVGDGPNSYQLWLGGSPANTRVGYVFQEKMKDDDMEKTMRPILRAYKQQRQPAPGTPYPEAFGDFCGRLGKEGVAKSVAAVGA